MKRNIFITGLLILPILIFFSCEKDNEEFNKVDKLSNFKSISDAKSRMGEYGNWLFNAPSGIAFQNFTRSSITPQIYYRKGYDSILDGDSELSSMGTVKVNNLNFIFDEKTKRYVNSEISDSDSPILQAKLNELYGGENRYQVKDPTGQYSFDTTIYSPIAVKLDISEMSIDEVLTPQMTDCLTPLLMEADPHF
jgi:hypothetical protein